MNTQEKPQQLLRTGLINGFLHIGENGAVARTIIQAWQQDEKGKRGREKTSTLHNQTIDETSFSQLFRKISLSKNMAAISKIISWKNEQLKLSQSNLIFSHGC